MIHTFLLLLLLPAALLAEVVQLNTNSFDQAMLRGDWLVKFYAPWCSHCKQLAPKFEEASNEQTSLLFAKVDCTLDKSLCAKYQVQGYPTLKFFRDGVPKPYRGSRSTQGFLEFAQIMSSPSVHDIEQRHLSQALDANPVAFFFRGRDLQAQRIFEKCAKSLQGEALFFTSSDPLVSKHLSGDDSDFNSDSNRDESNEMASVQWITKGVEYSMETARYTQQPFSVESLQTWVHERSFPLVSALGSHNFGTVVGSGKLVAIVIVEGSSPPEDLENGLRKLALERTKYRIAHLDGRLWKGWLEKLEAPLNVFPSMVVFDGEFDQFYLPEAKSMDMQDINSFLDQVDRGEIPAKGKSKYSLSKMISSLDNYLSMYFTETQIIITTSVIMLLLILFTMFVLCGSVAEPSESAPKPKTE